MCGKPFVDTSFNVFVGLHQEGRIGVSSSANFAEWRETSIPVRQRRI